LLILYCIGNLPGGYGRLWNPAITGSYGSDNYNQLLVLQSYLSWISDCLLYHCI